MKKILLDTNAYVAFKRGAEGAVDVIRLADDIRFSTVVLGELLAGFAGGSQEAKNRSELSAFMDSPRVSISPATDRTAEFYAIVFEGLRRKGHPIPTNDLWIAATALEQGAAVFTFDKHFAAVDNLWIGHKPEHFLP